ncbi:MAG: polysaccharide deacetylase family protein [Fusobacteria bacterium]|nr:polysaccharide deacetylase family protein [Fusobacteriota bacterium]
MIEIVCIVVVAIVLYAVFNQNGFPVFLFHKIDDQSDTNELEFEAILKHLQEKQFKTVTAREIENGVKIDKKCIMLTFDDGYLNNYQKVFPLIKKYQTKITLFINSDYILENEEVRAADTMHSHYPFLLWSEIQEMQESGLVDIQLHTGKHYFHFVSSEIKEVFTHEENLQDLKNYQELYGREEALEGLPIFRKRGATSQPGFILDLNKLDALKTRISKYSELKLANKALDFLEYGRIETIKEFKKRIVQTVSDNQLAINHYLGYNAKNFAWPWGHFTKNSVEVMGSIGIKGLYTCIKGPNRRKVDLRCIRRDSFRQASLKRFKWKLYLCRNTILGKIYEWVS